MQVDVVELFKQGQRLPRDVVRSTPPVRGELRIQKYLAWHNQELAPTFAELVPIQLDGLDKVRILYARGRNLVLYGQQVTNGREYEQIWWCRFVSDLA